MKCMRVDDQGYVVTLGEYDECPSGMFVVSDDVQLSPTHYRKKWIGGQVVETDEPIFGKPKVSTLRAAQYPAVGDQLDAIWKAIAPLIDHPEAQGILAKIQAVKEANPKS